MHGRRGCSDVTVVQPGSNSPGSTLKYFARAETCLIASFRLPARISDSVDSGIPVRAATRAWVSPLNSMRDRNMGIPLSLRRPGSDHPRTSRSGRKAQASSPARHSASSARSLNVSTIAIARSQLGLRADWPQGETAAREKGKLHSRIPLIRAFSLPSSQPPRLADSWMEDGTLPHTGFRRSIRDHFPGRPSHPPLSYSLCVSTWRMRRTASL